MLAPPQLKSSKGRWLSQVVPDPSLFQSSMDSSAWGGSHIASAALNHDYFQPFNTTVTISQTRQILQEKVKSDSAGSESAEAMRSHSEVHHGYLSQHPCCLAEPFPWTLPAPEISIRTELGSTLSAFKSLNVLKSPYPWSHVAECSWICHCCEQHCCTQMGQQYLGVFCPF